MNKESNHSLSMKAVVFGLLFVCTVILGVNSYFDPWHLFTKIDENSSVLINQAHFQNAGIIQNYPMQTVIFASSNGVNISNVLASRVLESEVTNLSVSGNTILPRMVMLKHLLKTQKSIKHVIISMDFDFMESMQDLKDDSFIQSFNFLYNNYRIDDLRLYASLELFACLVANYRCQKALPGKKRSSLDGLYRDDEVDGYDEQFGLENWSIVDPTALKHLRRLSRARSILKSGKKNQFPVADLQKYKKEAKKIISEGVVALIKEYPQIQFTLFLPPISIYYWGILAQTNELLFERHLENVHHSLQKIQGLENVSYHALEHLELTGDLSNYKDMIHYHPNFNELVLQSIVSGDFRLDSDLAEKHTERLKERALAVDLNNLSDRAQIRLAQPKISPADF